MNFRQAIVNKNREYCEQQLGKATVEEILQLMVTLKEKDVNDAEIERTLLKRYGAQNKVVLRKVEELFYCTQSS